MELYGRGLILRVDGLDRLVGQTEGVSPAFIPTSEVALPSKTPWTRLPEAKGAADG